MLKRLLIAAVLLVAGYAVVLAILYRSQDQLIFAPTASLIGDPSHRGLAYQTLAIPTADGELLYGWWVPAERARGTVLFFHGNAGNVSGRLELLTRLHALGVNTLIFDYRGYGKSSGAPSADGLRRDAEAVWVYMVTNLGVDPREVVLYGRSLGGSPAAELAVRHRPAGLVLDAAFTSLADAASERYPWVPVRPLLRHRLDTIEHVRDVEVPVLILHSPADEVIPFAHAERLFAAASEPKRLVEMEGGHDNSFLATEDYPAILDAFLDRVL